MKTYDRLFKALFIVLTIFVLAIIIGAFTLVLATGAYEDLSVDDRIALTVVGFVVFLILIVLTVLGVLVYRDARRLGMNAWMWLLVAIYAPNGVGFIIYLIFRYNEKKKKRCPSCNTVISENYNACPGCGKELGSACPGCGKTVETDWKICPYCRHQLSE